MIKKPSPVEVANFNNNNKNVFHASAGIKDDSALIPNVGPATNLKNPKPKLMPKVERVVKQISQRDSYARDMNRAQRNGGSNGIGVGY